MRDKLLITGSNGFVGTPVLENLLKLNKYDIHITTYPSITENIDGVTQHEINLLDIESVNKLIKDNSFTHLIHMAWYVGPKCQTSPLNIDWLSASLNLIKEFYENGGKKCLVTGSMSEYDFNCGLCVEDVTPLNSLSLYGQAKAALYQTISKYAKFNNFDFKWVRLFNLYGKNEKPARVIPYAITSMLKGEAVNVSDCNQVLNFLNTEDAASGIIKVFESDKAGAFNVCADDAVKLKDVLELIKKLTNYNKDINYGAIPASFEQQFVSGDNKKLKSLGWNQKISLDDGILDTINWWRSAI